ncbi:MAG: hypothetical protein NVSMB1_01280 [Polyangiales bacterium]
MKYSVGLGLGVVGFLAALVGHGGCLPSSQASQCASDGDCRSLGFTGYICNDQKVCQAPQTPVADDSGVLANECTTNDECVLKNGSRPSLCRKLPSVPNTCIPLQSDDCPVVFGPWQDPNAVYVGSIFEPNDPNMPYALLYKQFAQATDLAFNDINSAGGIPGGVLGARRPFVHLHCNNTDKAYVQLAESVKVPAVLFATEITGQPFIPYATRNHVATICEICYINWRKQVIGGGGDGSLAFGTLQNVDQLVPLVVYKVNEWEQIIRTQRAMPAAQQLKVLMVSSDYIGSLYYGDLISKTMTFNGKSVTDNGTNFMRITWTSPLGTGVPDLATAATQAAAFAPDLIVVSAPTETNNFVPLLESKWGTTPKPMWLASLSQFRSSLPDSVVGMNEDLRKRIQGVKMLPTAYELNPRAPELVAFNSRYALLFPGQTAPALTYSLDAAYLTAYAIAAAGPKPLGIITGTDVAQAIPRVTTAGGQAFLTEPGAIPNVLAAVANGPIKLNGLFSPLNINVNDGSMPTDVGGYCVARKPDGTPYLTFTSQTYHYLTKTVTGTFDCP